MLPPWHLAAVELFLFNKSFPLVGICLIVCASGEQYVEMLKVPTVLKKKITSTMQVSFQLSPISC